MTSRYDVTTLGGWAALQFAPIIMPRYCRQLTLLKAVVATGVPVVLFVINAGPVDLSWAKENVAAIISAGYGGEQGGQGIADVLTGAYNPGGALAYTLHTQAFATKTPYIIFFSLSLSLSISLFS